ncbi:MAG TPA: fumarylacetoacetate hydrolase family protein [Stellaceae bacterium]|jgi:2-keto-4-pentenoate hydratase/2-oxohepta-3-ene-1,7-dioic acid hydratase in catechol pathway|nr:fumarylacetoacetate hydrolase family protein [Stellaceae bacterium]
MRICWYNDNRLGLVKGDRVYDASKALEKLPKPTYPAARNGDPLFVHLAMMRPAIEAAATGSGTPISEVKFLSPIASPTKVIGTPTNYADHIAEADKQRDVFTMKRPSVNIDDQGLFLKANSCLIGAGEVVKLRFPQRRTDHEMELGCIIGKPASNIKLEDALNYVAGYCIALDMVVRGSQDRSMRKSVDTYGVAGPWMVTADEIKDPQNLEFSLAVNGEIKQKSNTKNMIMDLKRQIQFGSEYYTLLPGDIIMTGTCSGVSQVKPGDVMHCEIEQIGAMDVRIGSAE